MPSREILPSQAAPDRVGEVREAYERLRRAYLAEPCPTADEREDRLDRLVRMLQAHRDAIVEAADADFGGRSRHETLLADVYSTLEAARHARRHVRGWMRPRSVAPSWIFRPSRARVESQPLGVVGILAPWNYPVNLALGPLAAALAAGNRVLVKPSELVPRTAQLLAGLLRETFTAEEVAPVTGGPEVARAVAALPLDHLLFTGSTRVGREVARAAAERLVPVTLELGGKSPALVHAQYPLARAAERIAHGKLFNGGQTCIAPDYVLLPRGREEAFAQAFGAAVRKRYPSLATSPDYTSIVNDAAFARLQALVADARLKGARVEPVSSEAMSAGSRRFVPTLVWNVTGEMRLMQEEIFGPILPVQTYDSLDDAIAFVNARPRPLALYYFDDDATRVREVLRRTVSGGACVNETLLHFAQEELPFGGVGESGVGAYHGEAGFETFSHRKSVFLASRLGPTASLLAPPYGALLDRALDALIGGRRRKPGA